jgi:hypothetical protein
MLLFYSLVLLHKYFQSHPKCGAFEVDFAIKNASGKKLKKGKLLNAYSFHVIKYNGVKTTKKILDFVEIYKIEKKLDKEEAEILVLFLKDCLDKKKLQRVKDVIYDKTNAAIKEIPALSYTKINKHFTLKNIDKRVSTIKSLPVKKGQGTIKNKNLIKTQNTDEDSSSDNEN